MSSLFLSIHDDDQALFGAFTIMREKMPVLIITDSWLQFNRGTGITCEERIKETEKACDILGCPVSRLGIRDDAIYEPQLIEALKRYDIFDTIYAPAEQGGNLHHDIVARAAKAVFGKKVIQYTTYTKTELWTKGDVEVVPTAEELYRKNLALECYESQMRINRPHFEAVFGRSEWLLADKSIETEDGTVTFA